MTTRKQERRKDLMQAEPMTGLHTSRSDERTARKQSRRKDHTQAGAAKGPHNAGASTSRADALEYANPAQDIEFTYKLPRHEQSR